MEILNLARSRWSSIMLSRRNVITFPFLFAALSHTPQRAFAEPASTKPILVATFSILADIVRNVTGDSAQVISLIGPNGDAHTYSPLPGDAQKIANARLVVANGLQFEGFIDRLIKASGSKAPLIVASRAVKPLPLAHDEHEDDHGHSHGDGKVDPHAWHDVGNVKLYVDTIKSALIASDPKSRSAYGQNTTRYLAELDKLDREIRTEISTLPSDRRTIVTSHDAFAYFQAAYGIKFLPLQGISTDAEPSAKDVANIIRTIKNDGIKAIFAENISDPRLVDRIAKETGITVGDKLYSDSLSTTDGPAPTYTAMMRYNVKALIKALSS